MRLLISLIVFTVLFGKLAAQDDVTPGYTAIDTLYAYVDDKHNTYFHYSNKTGHIPSHLAKQFHVREADMLLVHSYMPYDTIHEGSSVLIPFKPKDLLKTRSTVADCIPVVYTVRPKETVFKIARRYFDLKTEHLRRLNQLESNDISIDQQLMVGWFIMHPVTESVHSPALPVASIEVIDPFYPEEPVVQIGVAYWKKSADPSAHLFAMHRSARINSMIEITNPMFKTKVLVKVVGRIPPTYKQDIALVVSPAVAKKLGVLDPRFRAEMRFVE